MLQAVKTRRPRRFQAQLLAYGTPTVLLGGLVLSMRPQLLWFVLVYGPLLLVNAAHAWWRRERAVLNDLASEALSSATVFVVAAVNGVPLAAAGPTFLAVFAYFLGTVLYVKTMIRERGSIGYRRASGGYHLVVFVLATWWHPLLGAFFGLALARAWLLPGRTLRPVHVGIVEIVLSAALLVVLALSS